MSFDTSIPWVLLRVREQLFGVPATGVREMVELPDVTPVPNTPDYVLGLITLRGRVTPTIDLRQRMGLITADAEMEAILSRLEQAERAHQDWFRRLLETSQSTGGFRFEPPEEIVSFQSWMRSFHSGNSVVQGQIQKAREPHDDLLDALKGASENAKGSGAVQKLQQIESRQFTSFASTLTMTRERIRDAHRQIAVVLIHGDREVGITVDEVASIERLKEGSLEDLPKRPQGLATRLTAKVGKRVKDDGIVLILDIPELLEGAKSIEVPDECELVREEAEPAA